MLRTLLSFRGLLLAFGLVAIGLSVALAGELGIVRTLTQQNVEIARIREARLDTAGLLQLQIDEESAIRGFAASKEPMLLVPYERARSDFDGRYNTLDERMHEDANLAYDDLSLGELRRINDAWLRDVGQPVAGGKPLDASAARRGNDLTEHFRTIESYIEADLERRYDDAIVRRTATIEGASVSAIVAIALIGLEVAVFGVVIVRLRRELDKDRAVVDTLQNALSARMVAPKHLRIGTAYRSATRGTRVGGDVYDVYRLDDDRTLLVVADVSGKGMTAAVDATFVRYAVRALASEATGPDDVVRRFDRLYRDAGSPPEAFVTLFVGIHDRRDGTLAYANAGHEACWVRRSATLEMLAPTGPIVGIGPFPVGAATTRLAPGDLLVLATDGLTEARDRDGRFVDIERISGWLREIDPADPQRYVDVLMRDVAAYVHGRIADDLALLAVAPSPDGSAAAHQESGVR